MKNARFCYLAEPEKGVATLEHEGQRFVPLFASKESLLAFCRRCAEQLPGYRVHAATEPGEIARFLEMLGGHSLHVGIAQVPSNDGDDSAHFAILEAAVLAHALTVEAHPARPAGQN